MMAKSTTGAEIKVAHASLSSLQSSILSRWLRKSLVVSRAGLV